MDAKLKAEWVKALRSGEYDQTVGHLMSGGRYCCPGVPCDIQGADFGVIKLKYGSLSLSGNPPEYLNCLKGVGDTLAEMNDTGKTFSEIADYIEAHIPADEPVSP